MATEFVQIKYLQSQYSKKAWCLPFETKPLLLALVARKAEYDALDLKNWMLKSTTNKEKRASNSLPSIGNSVIVMTSKRVGLIVVK